MEISREFNIIKREIPIKKENPYQMKENNEKLSDNRSFSYQEISKFYEKDKMNPKSNKKFLIDEEYENKKGFSGTLKEDRKNIKNSSENAFKNNSSENYLKLIKNNDLNNDFSDEKIMNFQDKREKKNIYTKNFDNKKKSIDEGFFLKKRMNNK